jgi:A1 cistron-splicing factor AAR2
MPAGRYARFRQSVVELIRTLGTQLQALPEGVFDTELPELDVWFNEELEHLRRALDAALGVDGGLWSNHGTSEVLNQWTGLRTGARRFQWRLEELGGPSSRGKEEGEEDEEDGEYAPVVVEM